MAITQNFSSLNLQQHSDMVGRISNTNSHFHSDSAAFRAEEWDVTTSLAGDLQLAQSDHSVSGGCWRKAAWIKRTLREKGLVSESFLGTIRTESNTQLQTPRDRDAQTPYYEQDQYEHETSYTIYPATWFIRLGIHYGLRLKFHASSTQGWKATLKSFCPVPDDALIFEFWKQGNISAVRGLLSEGYASVRDTDSQGYTPLHVSL